MGSRNKRIRAVSGWHLGKCLMLSTYHTANRVFRGLNFVLWIMSILFVYETSGEKLEGIERTCRCIFGSSSRSPLIFFIDKKSWKNGSKLGRTISGHKKTDDMETPNSNPHSRP